MNGFTKEGASALSRLLPSGETAYCIPCAISTPDFKERAPLYDAMPFDGEEQARAWIRGRGYFCFRHPITKFVCGNCGSEVPAAYVPEDRSIS